MRLMTLHRIRHVGHFRIAREDRIKSDIFDGDVVGSLVRANHREIFSRPGVATRQVIEGRWVWAKIVSPILNKSRLLYV